MIQYISIMCLVNIFLFATPIRNVLNFLRIGSSDQSRYLVLQLIGKLLSCAFCLGFWSGLVVTHSIFSAAIICIGSELIYRQMGTIKL